MQKFFRHIRKKLIEKKNVRKYFLYAIGEILLVVIGILIALQLNNWNEQRKSIDYENTLLIEMRKSLNNDLFMITEYFEPRVNKSKLGIDSLLYFVGRNELPEQETLRNLLGDMLTDFDYRFDSGSYENLKSSGLNIIQNDSLRSMITSTYGVTFPAFEKFTNEYSEKKNDEARIYLRKLIKDETYMDSDGSTKVREVPVISDINNSDLLRVINLRRQVYFNNFRRLDGAKRINRNLEKMISDELRRRKVEF